MRLIHQVGKLFMVASLGLAMVPAAQAASSEQAATAIQAAIQSDIRSPEDKARDYPERMPLEVLSFFGLEPNMRVIEILPFGGWYSKILGPLLREEGKFYTVQPELGAYSDDLEPTLALPGMDKVEKLAWNGPQTPRSPWSGSGIWEVAPVDMVLTFRNYHNFGYEDRMAINKSAYDALKSGGVYGIVDHTRRHNQPDNREVGRRVDPVLVIKEVQDSGFVLSDYSDVLATPDDALDLEVGNPAVSGRTDRFVLLFKKP